MEYRYLGLTTTQEVVMYAGFVIALIMFAVAGYKDRHGLWIMYASSLLCIDLLTVLVMTKIDTTPGGNMLTLHPETVTALLVGALLCFALTLIGYALDHSGRRSRLRA
jgi:hypothetical protein